MKCEYDVLVVGGGLAGGSLALALGRLGLRVALVEAIPEPVRLASSSGERALAMAWGSTQILDQIGVWQGAEKQSAPIRHIHVSDCGHFGKLRMSAEQEGVPALGYVVTARVLETEIASALSASPVTVLCPASVVDLKADGEIALVGLKQGSESLNVTARLVVAADGGNSTVRKLLGIGQSQRDYGQTAIVTEIEASLSSGFTAYERFTSVGPLALLPMGKKRYSVVWTQKTENAEELIDLSESEFMKRLQSGFGFRLGRLKLVAVRQGFPLKLIRAGRMTKGRVVLVGNASHQLHPVAGQGLNLGLRDVALLVEMLQSSLLLGEDIGDESLLGRYAQVRLRDHDKVIGFTDSTVRIFSNEFVPLALARNLGLLGLDRLIPAKRLLASYAMGLGERIPRFG